MHTVATLTVMKTLATLLLFMILAIVIRAESTPTTSRETVSQRLKAEFVYDASKRAAKNRAEEIDPAEAFIALPKMVVSIRHDQANPAIAKARKRTEDEEFDWRNGGTILKKQGRHITSELKFSQNPNGGIEFLKFAW